MNLVSSPHPSLMVRVISAVIWMFEPRTAPPLDNTWDTKLDIPLFFSMTVFFSLHLLSVLGILEADADWRPTWQ